jgi:hypothetical protein
MLKVRQLLHTLFSLLLLSAILFPGQMVMVPSAKAAMKTKTQTITYPEQTQQNQSQVLSIPKLKSVVNVSVNTGNVSYTVNGETVTFTLSNGTPSRSVQTGGSPADSKQVSDSVSYYHVGCGFASHVYSSSIGYNSGGYSGTLYHSGTSSNNHYSTGEPCGDSTWYERYHTEVYSGTVSKPDTRTYQHYYQYTVTIEYIDNTAPEITVMTPVDNTAKGMAYAIDVTGTIKDIDGGDVVTVLYKVDDGPSAELTHLTADGNTQSISGKVPLSTYSRGTHTLTLWAEDDNGGISPVISRVIKVLSSNTNLGNFTSDYTGPEAMRPSFKKETTGYLLTVEHEVTSIRVTPTTEEPWSSIKVNGNDATSGAETPEIPLIVGVNNVNMEVTAEDGVSKKNYQLRVTRKASSNVKLTNVILSEGTLSPAFNVNVFDYTASVPYGTETVTVTPTTEDSQANILVNNVAVVNGSASKPIPLEVGANSIGIRVKAADGETTNSTQITVTRQGNADAKLNQLQPSTGGLEPAFSPDHFDYSMTVPSNVNMIKFIPLSSDSNASITLNGQLVMNGEESRGISLVDGKNIITIIVTAQDGTTKQYTVEVNREVSANALLADVHFTDVNVRPGFDPYVHNYTGTVLTTVTSTTVTENTQDPKATLRINGKNVENGEQLQVNLNVGTTLVAVTVVSPRGTESTYTFTITRPGSSNALLADMWVSSGTLTPAFSPTTNDYSIDVSSDIETIQVTGVADDITSKVKIKNEVFGSGEASRPIQLVPGKNEIQIEVVAGNGITTNTYTITVTKPLSSSAELKKLRLSYGEISPELTAGVYQYSVEVPFSVPSISVTPSAEEGSKIRVNGKVVLSGGSSSSIPLAPGSNTITIEVSSPDGSKNSTYQIVAKRQSDSSGSNSGFMVSPIDTQLIAMFYNPKRDLVTGELWHNGVKEATVTSRTNTVVFGSNGTVSR